MAMAIYRIKNIMGLIVLEGESKTIMVGSMTSGGRHDTRALADNLRSYPQRGSREKLTSNGMGLETSKPSPRVRQTS